MTNPTGPAGFILRLLTADGATAGVGVLVSQSELVTCAHIVNAALGRRSESQDKPGHRDIFEVCFPLLADRYPQRFRARVADWLPPCARTGPGGDLTRVLLLDLIPEVKAAVRDRDLPPRGRFVRVFGYPGTPERPEGSWVEAEVADLVGRQAMRLEASPGSAVGIQSGFSGSPVVDRETGLVLGLVALATQAGPDAEDSYAITIDHIGTMWPGSGAPSDIGKRRVIGDVVVVESGEAKRVRNEGLVILHVSDPRFGPNHLFNGKVGRGTGGMDGGGTRADGEVSTLFAGLADDLDKIGKSENLHPDLIVVTGDLTESGSTEEFAEAMDFLTRLAAELDLSRRRVVIVPGDHDVNRLGSQEDFSSSGRLGRREETPARPTWRAYSAAFDRFYQGAEGTAFDATLPWTLFEIPDLRVVVAGLNSTMSENHEKEDQYGRVGEAQLQWFADRLSRRRHESWIRIGAVHHSVVRSAIADEENLRDVEALDLSLGETTLLHLLLHGHAHDGRPRRLRSGLMTLSAGGAAIREGARSPEVLNRYQVLVLKRGEILRYARRYLGSEGCWGDDKGEGRWGNAKSEGGWGNAKSEGRWGDDEQDSPDGVDWRHSIDWTFPGIAKVFPHPGLHAWNEERGSGQARASSAHHEWSGR